MTMRFVSRIQSRRRELKELWAKLWKPIGIVTSAASLFKGIREFQHRTGPYLYIGIALIAFAVAVLFTIPIKSVRLLAARVVAFLVDLLVLSLLMIAVMQLLWTFEFVRRTSLVSMAIVWFWLLAFVLSDWRFGGTVGQLIFGLRLRNADAEDRRGPTLLKCAARNLLIVFCPVVVAGRILAILTHSRVQEFVVNVLTVTIIVLVPLSIAFCGGQSFVDILLRLTTLPRGVNRNEYAAHLTRRDLLLTVAAAVSCGLILGSTQSLTLHLMHASLKAKRIVGPPLSEAHESTPDEAEIAQRLRPYLDSNILSAETFGSSDYLQDLAVYSVVGKLPASEEASHPDACEAVYKARPTYQKIHLQINPETPMLVKQMLFQGMLKLPDISNNVGPVKPF